MALFRSVATPSLERHRTHRRLFRREHQTRLSRAGNLQINRALHVMAIVQLRNQTEGRAYYDRRKAAGKTSIEAMRSLKRRLSDIVYRTIIAVGAGPGGQRGTTLTPARLAQHPTPALRKSGSSDLSVGS